MNFWGHNYWVMNNGKKGSIVSKKPSAKSLIYIKTNNGPRMKPWGTPALTLDHKEDCPFNTALCFLFIKKCFKTFNELPVFHFLVILI